MRIILVSCISCLLSLVFNFTALITFITFYYRISPFRSLFGTRRTPCKHSAIRFCSKSHQDLFYTFKEFNSLIRTPVLVPSIEPSGRGQIEQRYAFQYTAASSLSLPLPKKTVNQSRNHIKPFRYDTLV